MLKFVILTNLEIGIFSSTLGKIYSSRPQLGYTDNYDQFRNLSNILRGLVKSEQTDPRFSCATFQGLKLSAIATLYQGTGPLSSIHCKYCATFCRMTSSKSSQHLHKAYLFTLSGGIHLIIARTGKRSCFQLSISYSRLNSLLSLLELDHARLSFCLLHTYICAIIYQK